MPDRGIEVRAAVPAGADSLTVPSMTADGALLIGAGVFVLAQTTLVGNRADDGPAIRLNAGVAQAVFRGNLLADNATGGETPANCAVGGNPPTVSDANLQHASDCPFFDAASLSSVPGGLDDLALLFEPVAGGQLIGYRLLRASPAIDAGSLTDCQGPDMVGRPRPLDGNGDGVARCDIGHLEFDYDTVFANGFEP